MCRHCSVDPSFRGFDLRRANTRLGWFSPLGVAASIRASARWVGASARRIGLRIHRFRFSACAASGLPLGGLAFGLTASAFRHAPLRSGCWASSFFRLPFRSCRSAGWSSGSLLPLFGMRRFGVAAGRVRSSAFRFGVAVRRVGLRVHRFRFSARTASEWPLGELVLPLGGLAFGFTASAFRHAPLRGCPRRVGSSAFRFGVCHSAGWPSGSRLPLFGTHRFGVALGELVLPPSVSELPFGELAFGLTASAFRHVPLRSGRWASLFFRLPLRSCGSAGWPSGSPLPLFGMHRSAPPRRRSEDRRSTPTRHLFHFKTLIPTC